MSLNSLGIAKIGYEAEGAFTPGSFGAEGRFVWAYVNTARQRAYVLLPKTRVGEYVEMGIIVERDSGNITCCI